MRNLPTGIVTFLFTDIEGSTDLWERHPEAMPAALERHDVLLRDVVEEHGGSVFKTVGDAVYAVFSEPVGAVNAAIAAQGALDREKWPLPEAIAVRMAVHRGQADERDGDYFGPPLNRVARILAAGHGGQILISGQICRSISGQLPPAIELRDLGERSLKDLIEPEHLYQVDAPGLESEFPPLQTLDARTHNLPAQATPIVGRSSEIESVRKLLLDPAVRLITLSGPGGTGKTRLGLQAAAEVVDAFQDGVFWVDLAVVRESDQVAQTILDAVGGSTEGSQSSRDGLVEWLRGRVVLLLLDNFEQVVDAAPLVAELMREAAALKILVTSQAILRLRGEHEFPVPPLSLPDPGRLPGIEGLNDFEAVALFTERAQAAVPSFALDGSNAPAVVEIVRQLDGLPLAIELAAARLKMFPPQAMLDRLGRRFEFLTVGSRDLPDRQRTLLGAIEWSHDLLDEAEQSLLRRLSVFAGGCTLAAAEEVFHTETDVWEVLDVLGSLVDKSLVRQQLDDDGQPRFSMLQTIRAFALEKLSEAGEEEAWRRRHAEHFAALALLVDERHAGNPKVPDRLVILRREMDNVRAGFRWAIRSSDGPLAVQYSRAGPAIWLTYGGSDEGRRWLEKVYAMRDELKPADRAHALGLFGRLRQILGDNSDEVVALFEESMALFEQIGDGYGVARSRMNLGNIQSRLGNSEAARSLFEAARDFSRDVGDRYGVIGALLNLGDLRINEGDIDGAREIFEEAEAAARASDNPISLGYAVEYLGIVAQQQGDLEEAQGRLDESLALFRELGAQMPIAWVQHYRAGVARDRGEYDTALELWREAIEPFRAQVYIPGIAEVVCGLAVLHAARGDCERASRLLGAVDELRARAQLTRTGLEAKEEIVAAGCRAELGEELYERLHREGRDLSPDQAAELALSGDARE